MDGTGSVAAKRVEMFGRRVAPVTREAVVRKAPIEAVHDGVALDFREDGGGRDARDARVPLRQRALRQRRSGERERVEEEEVRGDGPGERLKRPSHRQARGGHDAEGVDLHGAGRADAETDRGAPHAPRDVLANRRVEGLRVVESGHRPGGIQDGGAGEDGAGETPAADLVETGRGAPTVGSGAGFFAIEDGEASPLGDERALGSGAARRQSRSSL